MLESLEKMNIKKMSIERPEGSHKLFDEYEVVPDNTWEEASEDLLIRASNMHRLNSPHDDSLIKEFFRRASSMKIASPDRYENLAKQLPDLGFLAGNFFRNRASTLLAPSRFEEFLEEAPAIKNLFPAMDLESVIGREPWEKIRTKFNRHVSGRVKNMVENAANWVPDRDVESIEYLHNLAIFNIAFPGEIESQKELYEFLNAKIAETENKEHKSNFMRSSFIFISSGLFPDKPHAELTEKELEFSKEWMRKQVEAYRDASVSEVFSRVTAWKFILLAGRVKFGDKGFEFNDIEVGKEDTQVPSMPDQKQF